MTAEMILQSTLTCPHCGHRVTETMPTDACQFFYDCAGCGELLQPKSGDCCVFCSYGDVPCPPVQQQKSCCGWRSTENALARMADGAEQGDFHGASPRRG